MVNDICPKCKRNLTIFSTDLVRKRYYCKKCRSFYSVMRHKPKLVQIPKKRKMVASKKTTSKVYCTECGTNISPKDKFCRKCGKKQNEA